MEKRREFLKFSIGFLSALSLMLNPLTSFLRSAYAEAKRVILPKGTNRKTLTGKDPGSLDTRNLEITPLGEFETMGQTEHKVDLDNWRLSVDGQVRKPISLSYAQVRSLPTVERNVLLICPGFFAIFGRWKGVSMKALLGKAEIGKGIKQISFSGPKGDTEKTETFSIEEVLSDKVFLAYEVNGKTLPEKHGFPLRVVAEDHYGSEWVKYVYRVTVDKVS